VNVPPGVVPLPQVVVAKAQVTEVPMNLALPPGKLTLKVLVDAKIKKLIVSDNVVVALTVLDASVRLS